MKLSKGSPNEVGVSPERVKRLRNLAQNWVEDGIHPSLVMLVARHGRILIHEAFGKQGPESDAPDLETNTIFPIMSISKPITATAAMLLVEDGSLGLNRPVREYLPGFEGEGKERVLIRHLMTHTSGIDMDDLAKFAQGQGVPIESTIPDFYHWMNNNRDAYIRLIFEAPLSAEPDTQMNYGSANYDLLGLIVGRITGTGLSDFAMKRIFQPLEMHDTYFVVPDSVKPRIVRRPKSAIFSESIDPPPEASFGASSVWSTAADLAIFGQMFLNGGRYGSNRILSKASVRVMTTNQIPGLGAWINDQLLPDAQWGLGWGVHGNKKSWSWDELLLSPQAFMHSGSGGVIIWIDPTFDFLAIFFSVYLELLEDGRPHSSSDLFINVALASIVEL